MSKKLRVLIVDDEPLARERIRTLLGPHEDIEIVGEAGDGRSAVDRVEELRPDLMFLDVQMPQLNGFDVVARIPGDRMPFVVFVTAHDRYALRAFDVNAVDYLLKPYDDDRFFASLEKAKRSTELHHTSKLTGKLMDLVRAHIHASSEHIEQFIIKDKGREFKVAVDDLVYLRSEGNYLMLQTKDRHHLYRMTMNAVEAELDPARFLRIHRSYMVNKAHVRNARYNGNNEFVFTMGNGERIISGRSYKEHIAQALQENPVQ